MTGHLVKWVGWLSNPKDTKRYYKVGRNGQTSLVDRGEATRFGSHDEAVAFCKKNIRKGRFGGGDYWRSLAQIEEDQAP